MGKDLPLQIGTYLHISIQLKGSTQHTSLLITDVLGGIVNLTCFASGF